MLRMEMHFIVILGQDPFATNPLFSDADRSF